MKFLSNVAEEIQIQFFSKMWPLVK